MDRHAEPPGRRLLASRIQREVLTEQLVNKARLFGVVFGLVQFGLLGDYPPRVREAGFAIALSYGLVTAWSRRGLRRRSTLAAIRRLTTTTLVADAVLLGSTALLFAYESDPSNLILMVIGLLEAAIKRQMAGALAFAAVGMGVEAGRLLLRVNVHDLPIVVAEGTALAGMFLLVGLFAGGIVRLEVAASEALARSNDRLDAMGRLLRAGLASLSSPTGVEQVLREAVEGLTIDAAVLRDETGTTSAWPPTAADGPAVRELLVRVSGHPRPVASPRWVPEAPEYGDAVDGGRWVARPVGDVSRATVLAVRLTPGTLPIDDADALHAELEGVLRASAALELEDEMRQARVSLERLRRDVVAVTAHEIRTPVTVIKAGLETLDRAIRPDQAEKIIEAIGASASRLELVVEHLHFLERLDRGQLDIALEGVDLHELLVEFAEQHDLPRPIADDAGRVVAEADHSIVRTVLACLVDNALTHGRGRDVRLVATHSGARVFVDVSDDGPGIEDAVRQDVFERFVTASAVNHHRGVGVGLPLARELARLLGGDVHLLDGPRTTFRLELPAMSAASRDGADGPTGFDALDGRPRDAPSRTDVAG